MERRFDVVVKGAFAFRAGGYVRFFSSICFIKVNVSLEKPKQRDLISSEALMFGNGGQD